MPKLPDRSIIRKLTALLEIAGSGQPCTPRELAEKVHSERRIEFSFFKPSVGGRKPTLGYSAAGKIAGKVRFAIALRLLNEDCTPVPVRKDYSSERKAAVLFSERAKELLETGKIGLPFVLQKSVGLLSRNPPQLPTAQRLYGECDTEDISYRWFRLCLSILVYEPDGALGAAVRRLYLPRSGSHQQPGEIGE